MIGLAPTRAAALATARRAVAASLCCDSDDLLRDGLTVTEAGLRPGRLRFHPGDPHLALATFGAGVVVSASTVWLPWVRRALGRLSRDEVLAAGCLGRLERHVRRSGQILAGPQQRFVGSGELWRRVEPPHGVDVERVLGPEAVAALCDLAEVYPNALGCACRPERPDVVAAVGHSGDRVAGIAGASADSDELWQVGVDVAPACRHRGIAAALVSACAEEVLRQGRAPYYSTHVSHVASQSVALRAGFVPAWTEDYVYVPPERRGPLPVPVATPRP